MVKLLSSTPAQAPSLDPGRRTVTALWLDGHNIARVACDGLGWDLVTALVLNPTGALRCQNPANLAIMVGGDLHCVLPVSFERLELASSDAATDGAFDVIWRQIDKCIGAGAAPAPIWDPGMPVGDQGVELGAQGGHNYALLTIGILASGAHLVCPLSERRATEERYQAWFGRDSLRDANQGTLMRAAGSLQPKDGAAELNHFVVVDPKGAGWPQVGHMVTGADSSDTGRWGLQHVACRFRGWPQRSAGRVCRT